MKNKLKKVNYILLVLGLMLVGCADAQIGRMFNFGNGAVIKCQSSTAVIYKGFSKTNEI